MIIKFQISHAINRYVKLGFNLSQGTDIESAIKGISGTQVAHLEPNRTKGTSKKKFSLPGNSNWRLEKLFPAQLSKLQKTEIIKSHPQFSDYSMPETDWHIPLPHISRLKRNELVDILQEKIMQEILSSDVNAGEQNFAIKIYIELQVPIALEKNSNSFLLPAGWALKETQKFSIKGKGKRISKNMVSLLEAFFLVGDANKSDRYTAEDMLNEIHSMARKGLLEDDEIPKLTTISNWISGYAKKH
ncbi:hypothetical protein C2G38_2040185 [Gigaspora rosea]|uniref:Uncharacterized protein n=1 Tax=Gigaspora rosea TaxID=44941 RepID=A0A397UWG0_9GLOM|nr:hypothetical protein C2G38_2040185 [Gigaspora rosea]